MAYKMKKFRSLLVLSFFAVSGLSSGLAFADDAALLARLEALENEVKILKRQLEVKNEDEDKNKIESPVVTASAKDGFSIKSQDEAFKLKVRGLVHTEARFFTDNNKDIGTTDTFLVRRARPIFEGTVNKDFGFYVMPELGGGSLSLVDGYVEYVNSPELKLRAGKFKEPFQLERLQPIAAANFVETGLPANLSPNRDVGVQLSGDLWNESLNYAIGAFNGSADQGSSSSTDVDTNNDKDIAGRLFATPFKNGDQDFLRGLGFGIAGTHGHKEGATTPTFRSPAQASVFTFNSGVTADGPHSRLSPQGYWYWNQFGVLGEYVISNQELIRGAISDKFENKAWQISGTYVLTGEDASFKGVKPRKPFDMSLKQWGAWEIAARYGELDLDDELFVKNFTNSTASITRERAVGLGLSWALNNNVRVMLDYERTDFDGGAPLDEDRETENVISTRFQLVY